MLNPLPRIARPALAERPRPFPTLDRAFDAVERALARLGIEDPASLRSPKPVEEALAELAPTMALHGGLPAGTLLVLDPDELLAAEEDVLETVKDERTGGTMFVAVPDRIALISLRRSLREVAVVAPSFLFATDGPLPNGFARLQRVLVAQDLRAYRFVVADTAGFRVAVVARSLPGGGFVGLWSGDEQIVNEVTSRLRADARAAGHRVPEAAPSVPSLEGISREGDVWRQANELRAYRVVREAELREIARAAALKGVALRRAREGRERERASTGKRAG
jgi:hypothetical protein